MIIDDDTVYSPDVRYDIIRLSFILKRILIHGTLKIYDAVGRHDMHPAVQFRDCVQSVKRFHVDI